MSFRKIALVGGDERQRILFDILKEKGFEPVSYFFQKDSKKEGELENYDVVIFPVPVTKDKKKIYTDREDFNFDLEKSVKSIRKGATVFGASFSKDIRENFENRGIYVKDYFFSELFNFENASLTAFGAVKLLYENSRYTFQNKTALVSGFGRIGFNLAEKLKGNGLKVIVGARNEIQLRHAKSLSFETANLRDLKSAVKNTDYIFNTVPGEIFSEDILSDFSNEGIYFELASAPFGVKKENFKKGKYVNGGNLPGRFYPFEASKLIFDYISVYL